MSVAGRPAAVDESIPETGSRDFAHILQSVFDALDTAGVPYAVFRDYDKLLEFSPDKEIDLITLPDSFPRLRMTLSSLGFGEIPSWGHDPHRFFLGYFPEPGMWLKLDFVTALRFGKPKSTLTLGSADDFLARRIRREAGFTLAPEDEFLTLLVKTIVNDGVIHESRRDNLRKLFDEVSGSAQGRASLLARLDRDLSPVLSGDAVVQALNSGDWTQLLSMRRRLTASLRSRDRVNTAVRWLKIFGARRLRPLLQMLTRRGMTVALLAPDGAGKSTLAAALLRHRHLDARLIYMGMNVAAGGIGLPTTAWLQKQVKNRRTSVFSRIVVRLFNFPNALLEQWVRTCVGFYHVLRGRLVIFDRYVYDSCTEAPPARLRKRLRRMIVEKTCPDTDLVMILDAPGEILFARKGEHDPESLEARRQAYLQLAKRLDNCVVLDTTRGLRAVESESVAILWRRLSGANGRLER